MSQTLPQDLLTDCHALLETCSVFNSREDLRALFRAEALFPFRSTLPHGDTSQARVRLCVDHLLNHRLADGRPVLPLFLEILRDEYDPALARHQQLDDLRARVSAALPAQTGLSAGERQALFDSLLRLDFVPQVGLVRRVTADNQLAAFLVHGQPAHGQRLLIFNMLQLEPEWAGSGPVRIDVSSNGIGQNPRSLWRELAKQLGLPAFTPPADIIAAIIRTWQARHFIMIFYTVDYMADRLHDWLNVFWKPLVEAAAALPATPPHQLLLFLVDYSGTVAGQAVPLADEPEPPAFPEQPLRLPANARIPLDTIQGWVALSPRLKGVRFDADTLFEYSDEGVPDYLFETICELCGLKWQGEFTAWLET